MSGRDVWGRVVAFRDAVAARLENPGAGDRSAFAWAADEAMARFEVDERTSAFVWACVVVAVDPMMYPHLIAVTGVDGRRGLTPAAYAALTGVDERTAIELAYWLASDPPIVRFGLLDSDAGSFLPIATPYRATRRLIEHVLGGTQGASIGRVVDVVPGARTHPRPPVQTPR